MTVGSLSVLAFLSYNLLINDKNLNLTFFLIFLSILIFSTISSIYYLKIENMTL